MDPIRRPPEYSGSLTPQLEGAACSNPHTNRAEAERRKPETEQRQSET